ncbi:RNA polymerase I subunit RPC19 [Perkinsela sp. CCAP 1560/4]|nr:RNA polymerase I subunit RPC19 [Perkinsela sp. CCAP 1560/4]|eukprot:KNH07433.1 RNA polymerase I subunit RPC19 [Perkinsela sp. CCAP 1560/4]
MNGFCERDLHGKVLQQIQARHNGDIQVSTEHERKITFEFPDSDRKDDGQNNANMQTTSDSAHVPVPMHNTTMTLMYEDHTLGNVLRHYLMSRADVHAAGYVIPHPLEPKMRVYLQSCKKGPLVIQEELINISKSMKKLTIDIEEAVRRYDSLKSR